MFTPRSVFDTGFVCYSTACVIPVFVCHVRLSVLTARPLSVFDEPFSVCLCSKTFPAPSSGFRLTFHSFHQSTGCCGLTFKQIFLYVKPWVPHLCWVLLYRNPNVVKCSAFLPLLQYEYPRVSQIPALSRTLSAKPHLLLLMGGNGILRILNLDNETFKTQAAPSLCPVKAADEK